MPTLRCAILDDYQNVVLSIADWSKVKGELDIKVFNQHLGAQDNVVKALQDFEVIVAMRERTPFPRAVIEKLPNLKLLLENRIDRRQLLGGFIHQALDFLGLPQHFAQSLDGLVATLRIRV
jgi:hypothetical protein